MSMEDLDIISADFAGLVISEGVLASNVEVDRIQMDWWVRLPVLRPRGSEIPHATRLAPPVSAKAMSQNGRLV